MIRATLTTAPYIVARRTVNDDYDLIARKTQMDNILLIPGLDRPNPNDLFRNGQVGGWLDPYDLTKMWVDEAGTTPMTASDLGVGVGRIQSKGGPVITFEQSTSGDRPVWGRHPVSGIRNLLTNSAFLGATTGSPGAAPTGWSRGGSPAGTQTYDPVKESIRIAVSSERLDNRQTLALLANTTYHFSCIANVFIGQSWNQMCHAISVPAGSTVTYQQDDDSATTNGNTLIDVRNNTVLKITIAVSSTAGNATVGIGGGISIAGTSDIEYWQPQFEVGTARTAYQKSTTRFDITEVGQPDLYYFSGNGVNQSWRSAANLDLSGVNVLTVWAGVRTNQGGTRAAIYSHNTDAASFSQLEAPGFTSNNYEFSVRTGLTAAIADVLYTAPTTDALVGVHNRDARQLWRNGVLVDTGTGDSGANNLPDAPLDIFFRGSGPDRFFNGNLYSYIIAGDNYDTRTIQRFSDWSLKPRRLITA